MINDFIFRIAEWALSRRHHHHFTCLVCKNILHGHYNNGERVAEYKRLTTPQLAQLNAQIKMRILLRTTMLFHLFPSKLLWWIDSTYNFIASLASVEGITRPWSLELQINKHETVIAWEQDPHPFPFYRIGWTDLQDRHEANSRVFNRIIRMPCMSKARNQQRIWHFEAFHS